jgi:hypothetical protein
LKKKYHVYDRQSLAMALGCCMAVRRPLLDLALPLTPKELIIGHDVWLAKLSAMMGRQKIVSEPLQLYRRHPRAETFPYSATSIVPHKLREWLPKAVLNSITNSIILDRMFIFLLRSNQEEMCLRRQNKLKMCDIIEERFALVSTSRKFGDLSLAYSRLRRERETAANRLKLYKRSWLSRRTGALHLLLIGSYKAAGGWKAFLIDFIRS